MEPRVWPCCAGAVYRCVMCVRGEELACAARDIPVWPRRATMRATRLAAPVPRPSVRVCRSTRAHACAEPEVLCRVETAVAYDPETRGTDPETRVTDPEARATDPETRVTDPEHTRHRS